MGLLRSWMRPKIAHHTPRSPTTDSRESPQRVAAADQPERTAVKVDSAHSAHLAEWSLWSTDRFVLYWDPTLA